LSLKEKKRKEKKRKEKKRKEKKRKEKKRKEKKRKEKTTPFSVKLKRSQSIIPSCPGSLSLTTGWRTLLKDADHIHVNWTLPPHSWNPTMSFSHVGLPGSAV